MSSTPAQRFECPRCRISLDEVSNFCPECGADMTKTELDPALAETEQPETRVIDRRLSDSNQAWLGKIVDGRYRVLEVIGRGGMRSEEHTSELQSRVDISYAVFCLKK